MKLPYTQHVDMPVCEFNAYIQFYPSLVPKGATLTVFHSKDGMVSHFTVAETPAGQSATSLLDFTVKP